MGIDGLEDVRREARDKNQETGDKRQEKLN